MEVEFNEIATEKRWKKWRQEQTWFSNCKELKVVGCPSAAEATKLLTQRWFQQKINGCASLLVVSFSFSRSIEKAPRELNFELKRRLLVALESQDFCFLYLRLRNSQQNLTRVDLSKEAAEQRMRVKEFVANALKRRRNGEWNKYRAIAFLSF